MLNLRRCDDIIDIYDNRKHEEFSYDDQYLKFAKMFIKLIVLSINGGETQVVINQKGSNTGVKG